MIFAPLVMLRGYLKLLMGWGVGNLVLTMLARVCSLSMQHLSSVLCFTPDLNLATHTKQ